MYEVVNGEFGPCAVWKEKARVEPPDPKFDRIPLKLVLKEAGWSVETLDLAIAGYEHPKPIGRTIGGVWGKEEPIYSRSQIATWREQKIADLTRLGLLKAK